MPLHISSFPWIPTIPYLISSFVLIFYEKGLGSRSQTKRPFWLCFWAQSEKERELVSSAAPKAA